MKKEDLDNFELKFQEIVKQMTPQDDPSHDLLHLKRVVRMAKFLASQEGADHRVVVPAAWFHDLVQVPKNDPRRSMASRLSSEKAKEVLNHLNYPTQFIEPILHAIEAHSFSAQIQALSLEAQIVQDADRLDGVGAIGVARVFTVGGRLQRPFYDEVDPWCERGREWNDQIQTLDHFYVKLFKTIDTLHTPSAKAEGLKRKRFMEEYLQQLKREIV